MTRRGLGTVVGLALIVAAATAGPAVAERAPTRFYVRGGVLHLRSLASFGEVSLTDISEFADLAVDEGPLPGSGATLAPVTIPALVIGYVLPWWGGHVALETILGPPITLDLQATGTIANESLAPTVLGNVPTGVEPLGPELGRTKALPPMVTAVYRFRLGQAVQPYAGGGLTYMHLYDTEITNPTLVEVATPRLETRDTVGLVGQLGVEARFAGRYYATADLKLLAAFMPATVHDVYVRTPGLPIFDSARVGDAEIDLLIIPAVVFLGAGADF